MAELNVSKKTIKELLDASNTDFLIPDYQRLYAWETEVWIADMPDHMIHLNGDKFLGPR